MQYMELETAQQAAVKFEIAVQDSTQPLAWDSCYYSAVTHRKSKTKG